MLEQDNNFYLIIFSILIICLLDNVGYYREKLHFNHFRQFKSQRVNVHVILPLSSLQPQSILPRNLLAVMFHENAMLYLNVFYAHYCYDRSV